MNRKEYESVRSRREIDPIMQTIGFQYLQEPCPHLYHEGYDVRIPLNDTVTIESGIPKSDDYRCAMYNRRAYVANRTFVRFHSFEEHFPKYVPAWQTANILIDKHEALTFEGIFIPLRESTMRVGRDWSKESRHIVREIPLTYKMTGTLIESDDEYISKYPLCLHFRLVVKSLVPYFSEKRRRLIEYTEEHENERHLYHAFETENLFVKNIDEVDWTDEGLPAEELSNLLKKIPPENT